MLAQEQSRERLLMRLWTSKVLKGGIITLGPLMTVTEHDYSYQNVAKDNTVQVTPTLADVTGECSANRNCLTTYFCSGTITGTTTDAFDKKYPRNSVIT
jgi:hypothetical protein